MNDKFIIPKIINKSKSLEKFYWENCRKCSSCNGRLLDEENPIEPFKEIIIIKHCSCYKHHIEPFILRELQDGEDEENVV
ncbi:hypothetical protein GLOIN_2v1839629 [Rhizophagus irregularis DAOM 181602=DAOM 197198]|nr:hypothetical protein GLOIN_2v1839629 [Rhizophagus irregularis DAOM 181602=DAOM 197198]